MAGTFADLKKSRNADKQKLTSKLNAVANPEKKSYIDERFWRPEVDKAGNGMAVIRFLPATEGEDMPWVQVFSHSFQGPGGWYIENSLTTLNQKDPVSEYNSVLWNSGVEANKEIARKQKRKLTYISNILVVKDPTNPDNEGKVFLYKFGKKIFDKLNDIMNPEFEDESSVNPFDFWEGANFKLKIRNVEGYRNYDKSEFDNVSPLFKDDAKLEKIWKGQHKLEEFTSSGNFKSYDILKARLDKVLGMQDTSEEVVASSPQPVVPASVTPDASNSVEDTLNTEDDEQGMSYFEKLASDDK
tara:strand:+ start:15420 stop:16319 length:900 start_codon:yes stop_codon:yes gene_type:complete